MTADRNPGLTYVTAEIRKEQHALDEALRSGNTTPEIHAVATGQLRFVLARIEAARLMS